MPTTSNTRRENRSTWKEDVKQELDRAMAREVEWRAAERAERFRMLDNSNDAAATTSSSQGRG
jgi:hypothetical protein